MKIGKLIVSEAFFKQDDAEKMVRLLYEQITVLDQVQTPYELVIFCIHPSFADLDDTAKEITRYIAKISTNDIIMTDGISVSLQPIELVGPSSKEAETAAKKILMSGGKEIVTKK